jgi:antitoxin (DNA-binding transcriptional repressor) of toxin-antitoxin stability system
MDKVNIHEAKTHLSRLIAEIENGNQREIVIARNGRPAAKLVAFDSPLKRPIRFGLAKGKFTVPDDFDADNEYIEKLFYGEVED